MLAQQAVPAHAAHPPTPRDRERVRSAASLTLIAVVVIFVVGMGALVMLGRYRAKVLGGKKKRAARGRTDAWAESGKRMDAAAIAAGDDTVDIDPDELGPGDVGGGPERGPNQ